MTVAEKLKSNDLYGRITKYAIDEPKRHDRKLGGAKQFRLSGSAGGKIRVRRASNTRSTLPNDFKVETNDTRKRANGGKPNYLKKYIISSYILVWLLIIFVAGTASLVFHAPPVIMWVVRNLIAWSPTYLLLLGWNYFRPEETRTVFVKRCFSGKVKPLPLLFSFALTFGISVLSLFLYSVVMGKPMLSYINLGTTALPLSIFLSLTSGPTGEELGWRGFMREEFNKRYGFLKSSVCQGLVWCFWHTLLWVVDSEFTDWRAIPYVISNIVVITSITVLMNIFLERQNHLLYSVLLHFGFNILYVFLDADIWFFVILTALYLVITPIAVLVRNQTVKGL